MNDPAKPSYLRQRFTALRAMIALVLVLVQFFVPRAATPSALAATIPPQFFTVADQQGANDVNSAQVDLTQMGRDDSDPSLYKIFWSWDATNVWTGNGQTGDACALFDSDGDGNVNLVVCGQVSNPSANPNLVNQTAGSPFVFSCNDSRDDRCGSPSPLTYTSSQIKAGVLGTLAASPPNTLITDTDPFPNLLPDQNWPNDSTLQVNIAKSFLPAGSVLVNVCSYPSAGNGGNNNPFDCIVTPGGGFLVIKKDAGTNTTTNFVFTVNPVPQGQPSSYTITGSGQTPSIGLAVGTNSEAVSEAVPADWLLTGAACTLASGTSTGTKSGNSVTGISIESGKVTTCTFTNTPIVKSLLLTKTPSPTTYSAVGNTISYSYVVQNTGNVTINGPIVVTDDRTNVTCPAGNLAPGASITCSAFYVITQGDLDNGSVTNKATASGSYNGQTVASNQAQATVTAVQSPKLSLLKSATPATYSELGQPITYEYLVKNSGNVTLAGPFTVSDDKITSPNAVSCPNTTTLAPGAEITCTATYIITQANLDAGSVTNKATATNGSVTSNEATATINATQKPALKLIKTAAQATYAKVGDVINYSYQLENIGNVTLSAPYAVTDNQTTVTCSSTPATLAPGASVTCSATYSITQADLDSGSVTNLATATAKFGNTTITSNQAQATVFANQTPVLTLVKSASPSTYNAVNQTISYSYKLTNDGNVTLSAPYAVSDDKATVSCPSTPATLAPGASVTCAATYKITQTDLDAGSVTNKAIATAKFGSTTVTSNQDQATVYATQNRALTLIKNASPSTYNAVGQAISYSYEIKNTGNVTLAGPFSVTDDKIGTFSCAAASLAPGASATCSASYTIKQSDLDSGSVTNKAIATNGSVTSNEATATVTAVQRADLSLTKSATPTTYDAVGQTISYSYKVTNSGNVTLSAPYTVADNKVTVTCPDTPATLAPGASITCSASYSITQADLDAGNVTNTATAKAKFGANDVVSNQDQVTVNAIQRRGLAIDKTAQETSYAKAGDVIHYSYKVTNSGNVTLKDAITVSDDKATVTCPALPPSGLAPGASITCTASYTITQPDLDAGSLTNVASAKSGTTTSPTDTITVPADQKPALSLTKSATPTSYDRVNQPISYDYTLTNSGNVTLSGPFTVSDDKITGANAVVCPATTSLAPGQSISCDASYLISQADLDNGKVTNTAKGQAFFGGNPVTSNEAQATVSAVQKPALTIDKTAAESTYDEVGDIIHYEYLVTNSGNVTLKDAITVSDDKAAVTCPALPSGGLAPSASITCTASYTITQADLDAGSVINVASAKSGNMTSPTDTITVPADQKPALTIDKTAVESTYAKAGDVIHYSYKVTNSGNVTLKDAITVSDDKAAVTCPALPSGGLAPGASITCTASYTVTQPDLDAGSVKNVAKASATFNDQPVTSNEDTVTVEGTQSPALTIVKTADPQTYNTLGQTISYSYKVTNSGNVTLKDAITVSDDKATVTCPALPAGGLAPGASITCTASYTITQADLDAGSVKNVATASTTFNDQPVTSAPDEKTVIATQNRALTLLKSASPGIYDAAGQTISYSYVVKNTGNVTLSGPFTVSDDKAIVTCPAGDLAPDASLTCNATYTITQSDVDNGSVTNTATATNGTVTSNEASETVTASQRPALKLTKTAAEATYAKVGDVIHYSYKLENTGNVTLSAPFAVSDNKTTVTCPSTPTSLAPSQSIVCSASYTITQADLDAGSVTNVATATAKFGDINVTSNEDTVTVKADQSPSLALTKSANPTTYSAAGQTIDYSYVVKNTGNVTLSGPFTVSDDKINNGTQFTCATGTLAPGATANCTRTYTITQSDLDAGSVTNIATASATFNGQPVQSAPATATVNATQSPALSLTKTANPTTYSAAGQTIDYSYVVKNTGNVTLKDAITVSDDKATVTCQALPAGGLAPNLSITCNATYTITQADVSAGSVTNKATATTTFNGQPVQSAPATATVRSVAATAKISPTQTTCSDFAAGTAADLNDLFYGVKGGRINNVAPGVFFYYSKITAPSSSFTINVVQSNDKGYNAIGIQQETRQIQAILYDANCVKSSKQGTTTANGGQVLITVSGATVGQVFYIGIKYDPGTVVGASANPPPTVQYTFETKVGVSTITTSRDGIALKPKQP